MTARMLLFGCGGQLGGGLLKRADAFGWSIDAYDIDDAPFGAPDKCVELVETTKADLIVNAAAYTAVDRAESDEAAAHVVNATTPGLIAAAAGRRGLPMVHVSTDYVFDGASRTPYVEADVPNPQSAYGRTKLNGERLVAQANSRALIIRTAWMFSERGENFVKTMLRLAETRDEVGVVADQLGGPTCADDLAHAIFQIGDHLVGRRPNPGDDAFGVFHFSGAPHVSWADFAEAIFAQSKSRLIRRPQVKRIGTQDYPTPAKRPANSQLDTQKIGDVYGVKTPDWRASLTLVLDALLGEAVD